jgi:adenylate cyclase
VSGDLGAGRAGDVESSLSGAELYELYAKRLTRALTGANVVGAIVVAIFLMFVLPVPTEVEDNFELLLLNLTVGGAFMLAAVPSGITLGRRAGVPLERWVVADRMPDAAARELALRAPLRQMQVSAAIWGASVVVFGTLNAFFSLRLGLMVLFGIALGGVATVALVYLLTERIQAEITARALAAGVPERPAAPGVATRVLLAWALGTGIPLVGVVLIGASVLLGADVGADQLAANSLFLGLTGLLVGLAAMRIAARSVADPVESVRAAVRRVEAGDLEAEVPIHDGSEVGLLQAGFNRMVAGLRERERLRDLFGRHVGEDVARRALERGVELGGEVRECAALFVDVVGSTSLAAARPAEEVVELLNRFFAVIVDVAREHGGLVNKFEGDAALCIFGAPVQHAEYATRALAASRDLAVRLSEDVPELRAAIGVSAGRAVAGNVGAAERFEYTVIGDPVNEAARLSELAKDGGGLLASETIVSAAAPEEAGHWAFGEELTLRGRSLPTRLATPKRAAATPLG